MKKIMIAKLSGLLCLCLVSGAFAAAKCSQADNNKQPKTWTQYYNMYAAAKNVTFDRTKGNCSPKKNKNKKACQIVFLACKCDLCSKAISQESGLGCTGTDNTFNPSKCHTQVQNACWAEVDAIYNNCMKP